MNRNAIKQTGTWIVKIGSALLTDDGRGLNREAVADWVAQIVALKDQGHPVILVSSGSVAEGMTRLGWRQRPSAVNELQAAAAVGQMGLVQVYESAFQQHGIHTAQVLVTHEDLSSRERYLNARSTLNKLLELGVVPIINENDTVATDEIRFGDNDTLAGLVANLTAADLLVLLTDQQGLYDSDPRQNPAATLIARADAHDARLAQVAGEGSALGRGGMRTKVSAAQLAARSGTTTIIASGRMPEVLLRIAAGDNVGTLLDAGSAPMAARKQWLAGQLRVQGTLTLDAGAVNVLRDQGKSLLPVGVTAVDGSFQRGDLVSIRAPDGSEVARGLVNYDAVEAAKIAGIASGAIEATLGYLSEPELVHRDNMVIV